MTKNQKIAVGCGGAGCLGLILLVIVCVVLVVTGIVPAPGLYNPNRNSNFNSNHNSNYNSNTNTNDNLNTNSDSSSSSSTMSDDDKHRLLLAASLANDSEMMQKVIRKLGFITAGDRHFALAIAASTEDSSEQTLKRTFDNRFQLSGHARQRNDASVVYFDHHGGRGANRVLDRASAFRQSRHLQPRFAHLSARYVSL